MSKQPSPDMVEKVARAIYAKADEEYPGTFDFFALEESAFNRIAKAAIEALREPTPEMIEAAWAEAFAAETEGVWRAMINAAIGQK